jgi:inhibitor of cysteine peptidase
MSGSYFNSRMIGNYVYAVVSQPAYLTNETVILPRIYSEAKPTDIAASGIYYTDVVDYNNYFGFTTFVGLNIADDAQEPTNKTIMTGGASNMYVSLNDIYVTYPSSDGQGTAIYRIHINETAITPIAQGKVPGSVLNQYSMDEYNGYFRLATTSWTNGAQQNNVYVLNMSLAVVGKLENLATGENLHSARFMGDKCYLVTFIKTDPLFVIDLSQPNAPKKLGELHIPGYSDYLHPYDETHLIGVGKETVEASEGDFAWYQGLKLSLFDVSNVNEPKQLSNYTIGDRGTDSPVLSDPKAFLFDNSSLLVIPVDLAEIDKTAVAPGPSAYGTMVWQGVYVFRLTLNEGFVLKGTVTQIENRDIVDVYGNFIANTSDIWLNSDYWISRALYIGNTLYTVSNARVQLNSLDNLALIAEVDLS